MSFKDLKKKNMTAHLEQELEKMNKGSESYKDDRFWKPELDQAKNGYAVIRFLPPVEGEDIPWVRVFNHGFQGPGGWFIENCPTTLGLKCPVCEANGLLWNSGSEKDKELARKRKRKLSYISNIVVLSDPKNPDNQMKVFLFKYGKKIFDKIMEKLQPEDNQFEKTDPVNVFDFWKGADFKLRVRDVAGYVNYDKSDFDSPSPLFEGKDDFLEELWNKQYPLREFTGTDQFKSYDELKTKFDTVLSQKSVSIKTAEDAEDTQSEEYSSFASKMKSKSSESMKEKKSSMDDDMEEEDASAYFARLAEENG
jgi:hypothetical protein